jgi:lipopolysaccharide export system protein LptA
LEGQALKRHGFLALAGLLVIIWAGSPLAYGAAPKKAEPEKEVPLHITAARLEAEQIKGIVTFTGSVKAVYGDATLYSDQLQVFFETKPAPPKGTPKPPKGTPTPSQEKAGESPLGDMGAEKIDHIVAKGNVRMVQEDRVATGDQAIYWKARDEVVLTGNPQLWRAENTLKGERIIFYLETKKVLVESSPQRRVEALLYSQGTSEGKAKQPLSPKSPKSRQP